MAKTKDWLERHPKDVHKLLKLLTAVIIDYLVMQVKYSFQDSLQSYFMQPQLNIINFC